MHVRIVNGNTHTHTVQQHAKKDFVILLTTFSAGPLFCSYTDALCVHFSFLFRVVAHFTFYISKAKYCFVRRDEKKQQRRRRRRKQIKIIKVNTDALNYNEPFSENSTDTPSPAHKQKASTEIFFIYLLVSVMRTKS